MRLEITVKTVDKDVLTFKLKGETQAEINNKLVKKLEEKGIPITDWSLEKTVNFDTGEIYYEAGANDNEFPARTSDLDDLANELEALDIDSIVGVETQQESKPEKKVEKNIEKKKPIQKTAQKAAPKNTKDLFAGFEWLSDETKEELKGMVFAFYGEPFSGKTYLAAQFPSPFFVSTDNNYRRLKPRPDGVYVGDDIDAILDAVESALQDKEHQTVVVDTYTDTFFGIKVKSRAKFGFEHEGDDTKGYGRIYDRSYEMSSTVVKAWKDLAIKNNKTLVILLHAKKINREYIEDGVKIEREQVETTLANKGNQGQSPFMKSVDVLAYLNKETDVDKTGDTVSKHILVLDGGELIFTGNRFSEGTLKRRYVPSSFKNLVKVFGGFV